TSRHSWGCAGTLTHSFQSGPMCIVPSSSDIVEIACSNMESTKVLVTGAGALLGQGVFQSLLLSFDRYDIVAVDPDPRAVVFFWADKAYQVPLASSPDYIERIEFILAAEHPQVVLIGTDVELLVFARERERLEATYDTRI